MPQGRLALEKLAEFLGDIAHPQRLRMIRELSRQEMDVTQLQNLLNISQPAVSQHLAALKTHKVLNQRREGHHVFYKLINTDLVDWLNQSFDFLASELAEAEKYRASLSVAQENWSKT